MLLQKTCTRRGGGFADSAMIVRRRAVSRVPAAMEGAAASNRSTVCRGAVLLDPVVSLGTRVHLRGDSHVCMHMALLMELLAGHRVRV